MKGMNNNGSLTSVIMCAIMRDVSSHLFLRVMILCLGSFTGPHLSLAKSRKRHRDHELGQISAEKQLIRKLMTEYDRVGRAGRPVRNSTVPVTVQFGLGLKQMDLDEKNKILTMSMWTRYEWYDEYLTWNTEEFEGIEQLTVDPLDIWIPDIMLINTADIDVPARSTKAVVRSSGNVNWFPHCIYHSACSVDVSNFPFDKQECNLAFGSWTHTTPELDIQMLFEGGIDLSTFDSENKQSSSWNILNVTAKRQVLPSPDQQPNYAILTFELALSRKVVFSTYILTLPCVFLAFLTLVVFWLPPERPDRTALAMSTFSSFMVLLLILVEAAPPTANTIPKLGVYYCINMVIIVMTVVLSTLVINLSRGPKDKKSKPPRWFSMFLLRGVARILLMPSIYEEVIQRARAESCTNDKEESEDRQHMLGWQQSKTNNGCNFRNRGGPIKSSDHDMDFDKIGLQQMSDANVGNNNHYLIVIKTEMERTRKSMERLEERLCFQADAVYNEVMWEWRCLAIVLDRLFFVLYLVLIALSLVFYFPMPQNASKDLEI